MQKVFSSKAGDNDKGSMGAGPGWLEGCCPVAVRVAGIAETKHHVVVGDGIVNVVIKGDAGSCMDHNFCFLLQPEHLSWPNAIARQSHIPC